MDAENFDLGFDFSPLELAASQFLDVARDVGELQERAGKVAESTLLGYRQRLAPIIQRATSAAAEEFRAIAGDVRAVAASAPAVRSELRIGPGDPAAPPPIPPIAEPVPPGGKMPPVVQPGGRAWIVMITEACGPDGFTIAVTQVVAYVDGKPVNPPPGSTPGPVFNDLLDAQNWAQKFVANYPKNPCGEPPAPPPEPEPPTLPPFGCPPPSCVPVCPSPEPDKPKLAYCVWVRRDPLDCIVLAAEQKEPPDKGYIKDRCFETREEAESRAEQVCKQIGGEEPTEPPQFGQEQIGSFCDSDVWGNAAHLRDLSSLWSLYSGNTLLGHNPVEQVASAAASIFDVILPFGVSDFVKDIITTALKKIGSTLVNPALALTEGTDCASKEYADAALNNMMLGFLQRFVGELPPAIVAINEYAEAFLCPWLLPSAGEAQALYQAGVIDETTAINLGRLNGRCNDTTRALLDAGQTRFDPQTIVSLYWRGIWDRGRSAAELRARGFTDDRAFETLESASRFVPGPSDLVRFLTRDVADSAIVEEFDLDAEFGAKFDFGDEQIRRIAASQGVDRETLLYYWRAHWTIPSPTQLGEFWRRLRPGRAPDAARADRIGLKGEIPKWSPRFDPDLQVTSEQIDTALAQQDILPFWRDKFRAVNFLPLTRTDARRAYDIGVLTVDDVYESLIQDGYREEDALTLTEFAVKEKNLGIRNSEPAKLFSQGLQSEEETAAELASLGFAESAITNFLTREIRARMRAARSLPEFAEYVAGTADEPDLRIALEDRFFRPDQIDELIATAQRLGKARFRSACTEAARTRFLWGEIDAEEARKELRGFGWSVWSADEIVAGWECTLAVSDRLPTVRQLLAWIDLGVIDADGFRARMRRLRFPDVDIDRFLAQAVAQRALRAGKDLERAIRDQERQIAKERAASERAASRASKANEKRLKAAEKARTLAEKLALAITAAGTKWAKFLGVEFQAAVNELRTYVDLLASSRELSAETATKVVVRSVEWAISNDERDLGTVVELLAVEVDSTADTLEGET